MIGFLIQRVTGVALLAYLFLHVLTIHKLNEPAQFDAALAQFRSPLFKLGEVALLGTIVLHALNGVRLTLIDMGIGLSRQRHLFWWFAVGLGGLVFTAGAIPIFLTILE